MDDVDPIVADVKKEITDVRLGRTSAAEDVTARSTARRTSARAARTDTTADTDATVPGSLTPSTPRPT